MAAPPIRPSASAAVRALASLEQVTSIEDRIAELERVAGIGESA